MNIPFFVILISGVIVIIGVQSWQRAKHLLTEGVKAEAIVFSNRYKYTGSSSGLYHPVVRFKTQEGEWITQELNVGYLPAKPEGTKLEVLYDPAAPTDIEINSNSDFQLKVFPKVAIALGLIGVILGVLSYLEVIVIFDFTN